MATINFAANGYSGEVLEDLLVYTVHGNDTYEQGLIHIKPGVQKKLTLPHIQLGQIIQDNKPTPTAPTSSTGISSDSSGEYSNSERYLEPQDFMVYLEFNPRDFEEYWRPFQPEGPLVFRELAPEVQSTMLRLLIDRKDQYINDCIWSGKKGGVSSTITKPTNATDLGGASAAGPMKYFDGALARVLANIATTASANEKASGQVVVAGNTELTTGEQVEKALYAMWLKCPKGVRKSRDLKFVMNWEQWDLYDQYISSKDFKYTENADVNKRRFKGKEIVIIDGVPESTIFLGKFTKGVDSCLWMAVDYATDEDSIKIERLQANSELYFFQMRMKMDVNIVRPGEIVVWSAYKNA
jgi:hypothetical protein|nr:MAG TPA: major capsid protein [Bacteriophage sp.]